MKKTISTSIKKSAPFVEETQCFKYAEDVTAGKTVTGKKVKQACEKFLNELKLQDSPDFPWKFDVEKSLRPITFIETFHRPTKGDYDEMKLLPWQHFVEGNLYGWVDKKTGLRRYLEGVIIVGSGNGKSTMVTGNATFGASKDNERGAEVYLLANSKEQAGIIFHEVQAEILSNDILKKKFRVLRDGIYYDRTNSKIQPLATDSRKQQGRNVHLAYSTSFRTTATSGSLTQSRRNAKNALSRS